LEHVSYREKLLAFALGSLSSENFPSPGGLTFTHK
jgi:hypothetical protein